MFTIQKVIYLAGGCFWGVEAFISRLKGVNQTEVGYANGMDLAPTYEKVCSGKTGHAETVKVTYNPEIISLEEILENFYNIIDPFTKNRQGADIGTQYRTGIYWQEHFQKESSLHWSSLLYEFLHGKGIDGHHRKNETYCPRSRMFHTAYQMSPNPLLPQE